MTRVAPPFRRILCGVDFSTHSRLALRYAQALASRANGVVTAIFVNDPLLVGAAAAAYHNRSEFLRHAREELERFVRGGADAGEPSPPSDFVVAAGNPAEEVMAAAKRMDADLIVVGSQGFGALDTLFFGSTTRRILERSDVPVLAVPPAAEPHRISGESVSPNWPGSTLIVPLALDSRSRQEALVAARVARRLGMDLLLAHVVPRIERLPWMRGRFTARDRVRVAHARAALEEIGRSIPMPRKSRNVVRLGDPANEIAGLAAGHPDDMVAMALERRRGLLGSRRGSIAYRVALGAGVPVLALPPGTRPTRKAGPR